MPAIVPSVVGSLIGALIAFPVVTLVAAPAEAVATSCARLEVIAHRGVHTDPAVDENTLQAFQRSIDGGFSIETDVWQDADGVLWIEHDQDLSALTTGTGNIDEQTTQYLQGVTYKKAGTHLTTFADALNQFSQYPATKVYVEPKQTASAQQVAAAIQASNRSATTWVTGFNPQVHRSNPSVQLLLKAYRPSGTTTPLPDPATVEAGGANIVALSQRDMTAANIDPYHAAGLQVQDADANTNASWQQTITSGGDGQLTDFPDKLRAYCPLPPSPSLDSIKPTSGRVGSQVTLHGKYLTDASQVTFGGLSAPFTVVSQYELTTTVPAAAGTVAVKVTTSGGSATAPSKFTIVAATATGGMGVSITSKKPRILRVRSVKVAITASGTPTCLLDGKQLACAAPKVRLRHLGPGDHLFSVNDDYGFASWSFSVPLDDKRLHASEQWRQLNSRRAFLHTVTTTHQRGAQLRHQVRKAESVWVVYLASRHSGSIRVYLGQRPLGTIKTHGKPGLHVVRVKSFGKAKSGTLRLVTTSNSIVQVDGIVLSAQH